MFGTFCGFVSELIAILNIMTISLQLTLSYIDGMLIFLSTESFFYF